MRRNPNRNGLCVLQNAGDRNFYTEDVDAAPTDPISTSALRKWRKEDYPDRGYLQQLFCRTAFSDKAATALALPKGTNGIELLERLGYDVSDGWDPSPRLAWPLVRHYLREKRGRDKPAGLDYFQVSLLV